MRQSPFTCALDDGSIGERIAEGNAQLDHVGARIDRRKCNFACCVEAGIAGRQINNQARLVIESDRHGINMLIQETPNFKEAQETLLQRSTENLFRKNKEAQVAENKELQKICSEKHE